jgi:hypothetical protein
MKTKSQQHSSKLILQKLRMSRNYFKSDSLHSLKKKKNTNVFPFFQCQMHLFVQKKQKKFYEEKCNLSMKLPKENGIKQKQFSVPLCA